jgi:hypothetical protein
MKIPFSGDSVRPAAESLFRVMGMEETASTFGQIFYDAKAVPVYAPFPFTNDSRAKRMYLYKQIRRQDPEFRIWCR